MGAALGWLVVQSPACSRLLGSVQWMITTNVFKNSPFSANKNPSLTCANGTLCHDIDKFCEESFNHPAATHVET